MAAIVQTAMVMAAGLGTRMRPLTDNQPKPLVMVGGRALIDYSFERILDAGISHLIVNAHYLADAVEGHCADAAARFNCTIDVSDERAQLLETCGGLVKAAPLFRGDPILCVNSDNIWTDGPRNAINLMAERWDDAEMDALLLLIPQARANGHGGHGDFHMDTQGRLARRQPAKVAPFVYTGIQLLSRRLLRDAPAGPFSTNILWTRAIEEGRLFGLSHLGDWYDVGTPGAIPLVEAALMHG
ncbi:MAG: nucleotidyltransferase family protein [Sphingopyxis sp.]